MSRSLLLVTALAVAMLFAVVGWSEWWRARRELRGLDFTRQRLAFLETETRRMQGLLAQQQRGADAAETRARRAEIESTVESLRALRFLRPVTYREIPHSELPAILRQKLSQQVPAQEFDHMSVALAALGLIPPASDLQKTYLGLLGEQVGAFYDQHSRELFTFSGRPLANSQNRVILAHELTHALEDQHFHLEHLPLEAKGDDDRAMAASALVEGDATLVMNRYMLGDLTADAVRETLTSALTTDVRQLAAAPRYLRETLLFPYLRGQEFCNALYDHGGWPALAQAFAHPPSCTSQVMHPERFLAQPREEPDLVEFTGEKAVLGQAPIVENVLGEFGERQWLSRWLKDEKRAASVAGGWHGDRYLVFGDARAASYVWKTAWRSSEDAGAFIAAVKSSLPSPVLGGPERSELAPGENRQIAVALDGSERNVLIINASDVKWFQALKSGFADRFPAPNVFPSPSP